MRYIIAILVFLFAAFIAHPASLYAQTADSIVSLKQEAERGNAKAQFDLGFSYAEGKGVPRSDVESAKWYRKAAEQDYIEAWSVLGIMYYYGVGVSQDYAEAMKWNRKAADQGNAAAQGQLGLAYNAGEGVPLDHTEAAKWFHKAGNQGVAGAQYNLGAMYRDGQGVPQDYTEAAKWFRKAADQGVAKAQGNLGVMYVTGLGVPEDLEEAYFWFNLAAVTGGKGDIAAKDALAKKLSPHAVAAAQKRASSWKPIVPPSTKATDDATPEKPITTEEQLRRGSMYRKGEGAARDSVEAEKWERKAAVADPIDRFMADLKSGKYLSPDLGTQSGKRETLHNEIHVTSPDVASNGEIPLLWVIGVLAAAVLAGFVFDSNFKVRPAFQIKKRYNVIIACGFWFLAFRAVFDFGAAIYFNGALQFLLATIPAVCCLTALVEKYRPMFLPLAGIYMVLLGAANIVYVMIAIFDGHEFAEGMGVLMSMPLSVLPNAIITQVLPIGLGVYFLLFWRRQKAAGPRKP